MRSLFALLVCAAAVAFLLRWKDHVRRSDSTVAVAASPTRADTAPLRQPAKTAAPSEPDRGEQPSPAPADTAEPRDDERTEVAEAPDVRASPPPTSAPVESAASVGRRARGIWVDREELMRRPTRGDDWEELLADARRPAGRADIANQDSNHDVYTLADALVCVRTGQHCDEAREGVLSAIGTEAGARWLAVGRNLGSYVIAADLLDLREGGVQGADGAAVQRWMESWMTKELADNNSGVPRRFAPFHSGANGAAQEGFVYAAVAAYLRDEAALRRAWDGFRTFVCDPGAPDPERIDLVRPVRDGWTHDDRSPCAVNPAGTEKPVARDVVGVGRGVRIDGALVADMRRGGTFQWPPGYTAYPWVGLEGLVPAAVVLERAGYPAFDVADRAVLRAVEYLRYLRVETGDERWFDGVRARDIVQLVNAEYGVSLPVARTVAAGRTVGYTGWTHPAR